MCSANQSTTLRLYCATYSPHLATPDTLCYSPTRTAHSVDRDNYDKYKHFHGFKNVHNGTYHKNGGHGFRVKNGKTKSWNGNYNHHLTPSPRGPSYHKHVVRKLMATDDHKSGSSNSEEGDQFDPNQDELRVLKQVFISNRYPASGKF